jgi:Signal transduction histidine kinase
MAPLTEDEIKKIKRSFPDVRETSFYLFKKSAENVGRFKKVYDVYADKKPMSLYELQIENKKLREEIEEVNSKYKLTRSVLNSAVDDFRSNFDKQETSRKELEKAYHDISSMKDSLELTVRERTSQLKLSNMELVKSNDALVKSNKELEKIQNERSFFFANLSHELRTPLNAILGFSKILQEIMNFEDWDFRERSYVDAINISGRSLLRLVNSVHDFTKIELNELKVFKAKCNFRNIINSISLHFKNEAKRKGLDYILEINQDIPKWIISDELLIKQVLDNLLSNAIKFTKVRKN